MNIKVGLLLSKVGSYIQELKIKRQGVSCHSLIGNYMTRWAMKYIALFMSFVVLLGIVSVPAMAGDYATNMYVQYNGNIYKYKDRLVTIQCEGKDIATGEMPGIIINGSTLVPVREVFENAAIGATVNWNGTKQEVYISYLDNFIVLKIDSKTALVNNKPVEMTTPAMLIRDMSKTNFKTMIPIRFVSENLGFDVGWDKETFTANLKNKSTATTETPKVEVPVIADSTVVIKDQLDKLVATKAKRELPTELYQNPIIFKANPDLLSSTVGSLTTTTSTTKNAAVASIITTPSKTASITTSSSAIMTSSASYPKAVLSDITFNETTKSFEIKAKTEITSVSAHVWDGKVIIQVNNSSSALSSNTFTYANNEAVASIRIGENVDSNNVPYTKAVFDMKSTLYKVVLKLSQDRKMVEIVPVKSTALSVEILEVTTSAPEVVDVVTTPITSVNSSLYEMKLAQNEFGDYIDITGIDGTNVKAFRLSNPSRIVFDFPNTTTLLGFQSAVAKGQYVTSIRTSQFEPTTSRLVLDTDGQADYSIIKLNSTSARIQLLEPQFENISYDNTTDTPTIIIDKQDQSNSITIKNITYVDNYLKKEFKITLPGDYTSYFGTNKMQVNDSVIENISFSLNGDKNTEIIIKSTSVREFRIAETTEGLAIKAYKPRELYKNVIVVDAGHGGKDPGASVTDLKEKDVNLSVVLELKKLLDTMENTKVYYTRIADEYPTLEDRVVLANDVEADVFISLHCNSFSAAYRGTETLYLPGSTATGLSSGKLARIIQTAFTANTQLEDYKLKERDNLYVLKYTKMPSIILEMGYLTNAYDKSFLGDKTYHDELAKGVYLGIVEVFKQYPTGR